jgi:DNA-binding transcriptional LysR family regulator
VDVRQLVVVLAIVDHGTFTKAAAALHVSQPALSQTVRALEAELGTPLFHRMARRVVLTPAGEALLPAARQVVRGIETVKARVNEVIGLQGGHLDLVALPTLAVEPTARLVGRFVSTHPGVTLRLSEPEDTSALIRLVEVGECEVGIADLNDAPAGLIVHDLGEDRFRAVCPPGTTFGRTRTLTAQHLAGIPLVVTPPGTSARRLVDQAFAGTGVEPVIAVQTAQREALLPLVLAGAGTTLLPTPLALAARRQGAAVFALDPPLTRPIALFHRDGPLSPAAAAFVALAVSAGARYRRGSSP